MHHLRPYQRTACFAAIQRLRNNPLLVAPTGAGKTTMGVAIAAAVPHRVIWIAHRKELIDQAAERIRSHGIEPGVIKSGVTPTPDARVQVASVQTLTRRTATDAGLLIVDEAHRSAATSYANVFDANPQARRMGLTATPFRHDGRGLGCAYGEIITASTTRELIDDLTLIEPAVYVVKPPDLSGVAMRGGDYAVGEAATATNTPERRADIVDQWRLRCQHMRTLCFATSVEHSKNIVAAFTEAGIPAEHVDGNTAGDDRDAAVQRLRDGKTLVLSNVELFTEGFDLPAVEALIVARPTQSLAMHLQMVGRVMRRADAKFQAIVHDHAGNHVRLGMVDQPLAYSLDDAEAVTRTGEPLGLRLCPQCYRMVPSSSPACTDCAREFTADDRDVSAIDGDADMAELTSEHDRRERMFDLLCEERDGLGHKWGWVLRKFKEQTGDWPPTANIGTDDEPVAVYVNPETANHEVKRAFYRTAVKLGIDKGWKPGAASYRYRELFGVWPKGFVEEVKRELGVGEESPAADFEELMA